MIGRSVLHKTILCFVEVSTYIADVSVMTKMVALNVIFHNVFPLADLGANAALPAFLR